MLWRQVLWLQLLCHAYLVNVALNYFHNALNTLEFCICCAGLAASDSRSESGSLISALMVEYDGGGGYMLGHYGDTLSRVKKASMIQNLSPQTVDWWVLRGDRMSKERMSELLQHVQVFIFVWVSLLIFYCTCCMLYIEVVPLSPQPIQPVPNRQFYLWIAEWVFEKSQIIESFVATNFLVMI